MGVAATIAAELAEIAATGRLRRRPLIDSPCGRRIVLAEDGVRQKLINWASNDYLGAATSRLVTNGAQRAVRRFGGGSGAARLLAGGLRLHATLEHRLARFLGAPAALLTTTGYQANLAAITTLASSNEDAVILDRACHASTYDGCRLSAGQMLRFRHNDLEDLVVQLRRAGSARRRIVCVESIYSMDGDAAPLAGVAAACRDHDALLVVDEAHAVGVAGPGGRGLCAAHGVVPDLLVGTCSKSLGAQGGFLAGSADLIELAVNRARSFIFTTAPCPAAVGAATAGLVRLTKHPELVERLADDASALRAAIVAQGWDVPSGTGPIIPVLVGDETRALALAARLRALGHHAPAIRPPTVPPGGCRLRLTLTAAHTPADRRKLLDALRTLRDAPEPTPCPPPPSTLPAPGAGPT
jgi:8-amino-7-oxononanoate synthase